MRCRVDGFIFALQLWFRTSQSRSVLEQRAGSSISSNLPVSWTYSGCYQDQTYSPTLSGYAMYSNSTSMTQESCITFCNSKGFIHAGVEYMYQCFCGNDDLTKETTAPESDCNMACSGNSLETCGAGNRLNIFTSNQTATSPVTNDGTGLWSLYGCFKEGINGRALTFDEDTAPGGTSNMTVANCVYSCQRDGYVLAGVELGGQCYCGNKFSYQTKPAVDGFKGCNQPCQGNQTELCGGADHLDIYGYNYTVTYLATVSSSISTASIPVTNSGAVTAASTSSSLSSTNVAAKSSWYAIGCYTDNVGGRALMTQQYGNADIMTQELCMSKCANAGFSFSGTEYYSECYCDNQIRNGAALASDLIRCVHYF